MYQRVFSKNVKSLQGTIYEREDQSKLELRLKSGTESHVFLQVNISYWGGQNLYAKTEKGPKYHLIFKDVFQLLPGKK